MTLYDVQVLMAAMFFAGFLLGTIVCLMVYTFHPRLSLMRYQAARAAAIEADRKRRGVDWGNAR